MHSDPHSSSLASTECPSIGSEILPSSSIDFLVDRFLERCLAAEDDSSLISWGEDSGLPVNSLQTLARSSDSSLLSEEEEEEEEEEEDHEQQADDVDPNILFTSVEDNQDYATLLQAFVLATLPELSSESLQGFASEIGIEACNTDSSDEIDGLALVLSCSDAETLKESTEEFCPICLEGLLRSQKVQKLPCSHRMHSRCCKRFFRTAGVKLFCPCCRYDMHALYQNQT